MSRKFIAYSGLLIVPLSVVIYFIANIGVPFAIISIALLSVLVEALVEKFGDRMFTDPNIYMTSSDIKKFGREKVDTSLFTNSE